MTGIGKRTLGGGFAQVAEGWRGGRGAGLPWRRATAGTPASPPGRRPPPASPRAAGRNSPTPFPAAGASPQTTAAARLSSFPRVRRRTRLRPPSRSHRLPDWRGFVRVHHLAALPAPRRDNRPRMDGRAAGRERRLQRHHHLAHRPRGALDPRRPPPAPHRVPDRGAGVRRRCSSPDTSPTTTSMGIPRIRGRGCCAPSTSSS